MYIYVERECVCVCVCVSVQKSKKTEATQQENKATQRKARTFIGLSAARRFTHVQSQLPLRPAKKLGANNSSVGTRDSCTASTKSTATPAPKPSPRSVDCGMIMMPRKAPAMVSPLTRQVCCSS